MLNISNTLLKIFKFKNLLKCSNHEKQFIVTISLENPVKEISFDSLFTKTIKLLVSNNLKSFFFLSFE